MQGKIDGGLSLKKGKTLEIATRVLSERLYQDDIQGIYQKLHTVDRKALMTNVVDVLHKTSVLLDVSRKVAESISLDMLLPNIVELINEFLRAERTTVFLFDSASNELFSRIKVGEFSQDIRIASDVGVAGSTFTTARSTIVETPSKDPRFNPDIDKKTGYRTRSILCVPIIHPINGCIGVIQVLNRINGRFLDADVTLLETITAQAAAGFENARLHDQVARAQLQEKQLMEITTAISQELHLKPLLRLIMKTVTSFLDADRSTLFLYDKKTDELWSQIAQGSSEIRFTSQRGIAGSVFTTGEIINITDAYADSRFNPEFDRKNGYHTASILCTPVVGKNGKIVGVIQVLNKQGGSFSRIDEQRAEAFCAQAAIALENAQLFEDVVNIKNYNESILQCMSNAVLTLDEKGEVITANDAAHRLLKTEITEIQAVGQDISNYLSEGNSWLMTALTRVKKTRKSDTNLDVDMMIPGCRELAPVNATTLPLTDIRGDCLGALLVLEDLTKEKRLRNTMARYMTKEVADKLLDEGESVLGGLLLPATVLFSDIRNFTTISEKLGATETVSMLNDYFSIMVDLVLQHEGILDKYIGDAIMAVFGAPFSKEYDADNAVQTAIKMMKTLQPFNEGRIKKGKEPVYIGIGLNTDDVLSGNIGSERRMDYTVIGDGVNLAARLEGATKVYKTDILISESTVNALHKKPVLREMDLLTVKGKTEPVAIYEVLDHLNGKHFPHREEVLELSREALEIYRAGYFSAALKLFEQSLRLRPDDGFSQVYVQRSRQFVENPPAKDWNGAWVMDTK